MSQILALSFDCPASPSLTLQNVDENKLEQKTQGWGFAWYPSGDYAAVVIKDEHARSGTRITSALQGWKRFHSTNFLCHIRGATKGRVRQQDTQPFRRTYAGRDWVMMHKGDLEGDYTKAFSLGESPGLEPLGVTDSEHIFCWLLMQIHQKKLRCLAELEWSACHELFQRLNKFGTLNVMISDGQDLVVYHDSQGFYPIYYCRLLPPHQQTHYELNGVVLEVGTASDEYRTCLVFSTCNMLASDWSVMEPGNMSVARRGLIIWSSANQ